MCRAIPGNIVSSEEENGIRVGRVKFGGISRVTCLDLVREASVGDYVLVHVGFALSCVDREEAERSHSGIERKPFAFPPESLFAFSPESCSPCPGIRNSSLLGDHEATRVFPRNVNDFRTDKTHPLSRRAHLEIVSRCAPEGESICFSAVSKPYLKRPLGLSVERRADSPGYWKD
jgi:hydrogenase expression/formation protein HypC